MNLPGDVEIAAARRLILVVGLAYLVAQLLLFSLDRPPSWDEAIYLSQVAPGGEPLTFVPYRARGVTLLAIPVLQLGGSLAQLRLFLAVASAAALTGSFRVWSPVIGYGAVAAALVFAGAWPTLFYGSELMPNLWVALVAGAATAVLARRFAGRGVRSDELVAGGLVAVAALIRPLDAVMLTAALVLLPIAVRRATVSWTVHLMLGLVAGWTPWLVEMTARFGSPGEAFTAAARMSPAGRWSLLENARRYLALSDGPTIGSAAARDIPVNGLLWVIGTVVLVVVGIWAASRRDLRPSVVAATATGVALASGYVVLTDAQAPRFLLPSLALIAVPAGVGLVTIVAGVGSHDVPHPVRLAGRAAASTLVVAWAVMQMGIAVNVEAEVAGQRASAQRAGFEVRRLASGEPCQIYGEGSFPIVGFTAGCRAAALRKILPTWTGRPDDLVGDAVRVFLVLHRAEAVNPPEGSALVAEVPSQGERTWFIYRVG